MISNSDTREASLLFSYAKEVSESGALEQDEKPEDIPGRSILLLLPLLFFLSMLKCIFK